MRYNAIRLSDAHPLATTTECMTFMGLTACAVAFVDKSAQYGCQISPPLCRQRHASCPHATADI